MRSVKEMKMCHEGRNVRARKDERPNLSRDGRIWKPLTITLDGKERMALISGHWLYFEENDQWYKMNCEKYEIEPSEGLPLTTRATIPLTEEEKRARKKARRAARKAAAQAEDEEDEEDE